MIIKESKLLGDKSPFCYKYIPETEEELVRLYNQELSDFLNFSKVCLFVERETFDNAIKCGYLKNYSILRYSVDAIEFDSSYDNVKMEWRDPEWISALFKTPANSREVILVIDIDKSFPDAHKMHCLISLVKDRNYKSECIPDNVHIVIVGSSFDELSHRKDRNIRELLGVCHPVCIRFGQRD